MKKLFDEIPVLEDGELVLKYQTPEGFSDMIMYSDGQVLTGLLFENPDDPRQRGNANDADLPVFQRTREWLDLYFSGHEPDFLPEYKLCDATDFRREVSEIMRRIPYGQVITYQDIAEEIAAHRGIRRMSAQAVGQAVGWNPICIIIPCHRVIGKDGSLTGYGGGIENKIRLLTLEGYDRFSLPKKRKKDSRNG